MGRNQSEAVTETRPGLFEWHGAEVIFISLMIVVGALGNALVLYVTHFRWKQSIFSFSIKTLAWLDVSNLLVALPMLLVITVQEDTPHYSPLCRCLSFVALFTAVASACVLVVIAANRFRKICQPQRSQVTVSLAFKLTIGSFVFGASISIPSGWIFDRNTVTYSGGVNISYCFINHQAPLSLLVSWAVVVGLTFLAVTASLVVLYGFTVKALRAHDRRLSTMSRRPSSTSNSSKSVSRKHTMVFIAVTAVFFMAYSPYFITVILLLVNVSMENSMGPVVKAIFDIAKLFPLLSNVSNPIIYSFTSAKFRGECKKVFKFRPCLKALNLIRKDSVTTSHEMSKSEEES